jgi:hypothetical protein
MALVIQALSGGELSKYHQDFRQFATLPHTQVCCALAFETPAL